MSGKKLKRNVVRFTLTFDMRKVYIVLLVAILILSCGVVYELVSYNLCRYFQFHAVYRFVGGNYGGIAMPSGISLYFVDGSEVQLCSLGGSRRVRGFYVPSTHSVYIAGDMSFEDKQSVLVHELAHDSWRHVMTRDAKLAWDDEYDLVCKDTSEYYAYSSQQVWDDYVSQVRGVVNVSG